jgi:hypothetical protein
MVKLKWVKCSFGYPWKCFYSELHSTLEDEMIPNFGSVLCASQCLSILKGHIANKEKQLEASHKLPIILWGLLALLEEFSLEFSSLHTFASHKDNYLLKSVSLEFESLCTLHPTKTHYLLLVVMLLLHT